MALELTPEQLKVLRNQDGPVEVVDPDTQRRYLLIAEERVRRKAPKPPPGPELEVAEGLRLSQEALRRDLPELLANPKLVGKWVAYHRHERVGIASTQTALVQKCLAMGWDDDEFYVGLILPGSLPIDGEELDPPPPWLMED